MEKKLNNKSEPNIQTVSLFDETLSPNLPAPNHLQNIHSAEELPPSTSFSFLESNTLQNAANPLPKHECAVALNAPGKYEMGSAPMLLARTTANAEFCIPVSMEIVRAVRSGNLNTCLGTKYPAAKPSEWVTMTVRRMRAGRDNTPGTTGLPIHMEALFATTPPHIKLTNTTLANGVHLETHLHNLGKYSFSITPPATGAKTTFAHAAHNA
eukprot:CAMPEP_0196224638 /NCGR_PEP_ID=MMETSP0912-20130531/49188_1 /TAXON_ID=49265 /ORGANISM="Thalassiosira rotula, Strain GSO102" /LENGTH=210 /DNA_ID=CAMNT_0041504031 /DNA_START=136 /DNA_END=766 /DNA_ORIENTATION=-